MREAVHLLMNFVDLQSNQACGQSQKTFSKGPVLHLENVCYSFFLCLLDIDVKIIEDPNTNTSMLPHLHLT